MKMNVIARVHSDFSTKFGIPRQSRLVDTPARVVLEPPYNLPDAVRAWKSSAISGFCGSSRKMSVKMASGPLQYGRPALAVMCGKAFSQPVHRSGPIPSDCPV